MGWMRAPTANDEIRMAGAWGTAQFTPVPNMGPVPRGGPEQPADLYTKPAAQQGPTGPTVPAPGQVAYSQPASPNWGAAASPPAKVHVWPGTGAYTYALWNDGTIQIVATKSGPADIKITKASNAQAYAKILEEFIRLYPKSPIVPYAKHLMGAGGGGGLAQAVTALATAAATAATSAPAAFQPSPASAPPTAPMPAPAAASSPGARWPWLVGGAAAFIVIVGGTYLLLRKKP